MGVESATLCFGIFLGRGVLCCYPGEEVVGVVSLRLKYNSVGVIVGEELKRDSNC